MPLIADMRSLAEIGANVDVDRHCDPRTAPRPHSLRFSNDEPQHEAFHVEVLTIVEIDADDRIAAVVSFDPDDIDAAFEELDARYLAGEAAAHAHTWSVITGGYAALNRHELPPTTPDSVQHRPPPGRSVRAR